MTAKTAPKVTLWEFFQQLGKTFMLPVALLSFCGIMLGISSSLVATMSSPCSRSWQPRVAGYLYLDE